MEQKVAEIRCEQWRRTVSECINRNSDISKRQWCKDNGIRYRSLMYWQHKFQQEAIEQMDHNSMASASGHAVQVCSPAFADVTAQYKAMTADMMTSSQPQEGFFFTPELMIEAGECRLYVNGSIQASTLEKVMQVLSHA